MNKLLALFLGDGRRAALLLALGSAGLLATVYFFQYVLLILPCELCYWQRKPHMAIVVVGLIGALLAARRARVAALVAIALLALGNVGLSVFHVGVEYHWWQGLANCSAPTAVATTMEEARRLIFQSTVIPCDKPGWVFLGISMAAWNGIACLLMAGFAALGAWRSARS